ncbi:MAG: aspartate kinase [Synergistaceae bacterium]|nr:aspartate kinase [Synergistaceae bacterium]
MNLSEIIVQKYGGSSVATPEKIKGVAEKVKKRVRSGVKMAVVVSAMGKTTDSLLNLAGEVAKHLTPRELDMLLATGEQMTSALLAMALNDKRVPAVSRNAFQLGIITSNNYSNARIVDMNLKQLERDFETNDVVVITGFQGITEDGNLTTLGRGGSDTSAVAIAAKAGAVCEIYSDVAGVYTADPKLISGARKLDAITYDEMLELAALGAKVLHSRSVELAKIYNVTLYCASTFSDEKGTFIVNKLPEWLEHPVVTGVTMAKKQIKFSLVCVNDGDDILSKLFHALAENNVNVDMISTAIDGEEIYITFSVIDAPIGGKSAKKTAKETVKNCLGVEPDVEDAVKVSAVGVGMNSASGVAARYFNALNKCGVKILGVTTSEIKISALVREDQAEIALKAIVDEFGLTD